MVSLKSVSLIYTILFGIVVIVLFVTIAFRIYQGFISSSDRKPIKEINGNWFLKTLKILFGISMFMMIINIPFYGLIGSAVRSVVPNYLNNIMISAVILLAGIECFLTFSISTKLLEKTFKKVELSIAVLIMLPLSIYLAINISNMFDYPQTDKCYLIDLPVKGDWIAGHAGGSEQVNYHCAYEAQKFAIDIVKVDESGMFYKNEGKEIEDFYTLNENIYSPVDGIIVNVVDSFANQQVLNGSDKKNPAGNHIVIEIENERYLFLAHLNLGTIKVLKGDIVKAGDLIAQAGNSGNTTWPHLHMHIQDKPIIDNKNAKAFPFRFGKMDRKRWLGWTNVKDGFLVRNDLFRNS
ncbi:MAG: M23 family metallopeptidase [Bacteroidia bacterium]|nr:M23 family metallopeptidase [Bacteroidia bacterium]